MRWIKDLPNVPLICFYLFGLLFMHTKPGIKISHLNWIYMQDTNKLVATTKSLLKCFVVSTTYLLVKHDTFVYHLL